MIHAVRTSVADDLMIKQVETIKSTSSVVDAARFMIVKKLQYLVVVDGDRRVVGVVTQNDILEYVSEPIKQQGQESQGRSNAWESEISSLITQDLITVKRDLPISELAWTLVINRIDCLPVVDEAECLIGAVGVRDVIKHLSSTIPSRSDTGFEFYAPPDKEERPNLPAFFRRACGTLVVPVRSLDDVDLELKFARLGYDGSDGRIVIKLVADQRPGDQRVSRETINRDGVYLAIPASDFVEHFNINRRIRAYDISCHAGDIFLIPRQ